MSGIDIAGLKLMVAVPTSRDLDPEVVLSLLNTQLEMVSRSVPHEIKIEFGGASIFQARSLAVDNFLRSDKNRMLFLDSDIAFEAAAVSRLLAISTKHPIVAGAYVFKREPLLFGLDFEDDHFTTDEFGCIEIKGLGLGFTMLHREVLEKMAAKAPKLKFPQRPWPVAHIFSDSIVPICDDTPNVETYDGALITEDILFFNGCRELGYKVKLDPSIVLGHVGRKVYRQSFMDALIKQD